MNKKPVLLGARVLACLFVFAVFAVLTLLTGQVANADTQQTPNVIFILMDDMGYSDVSCYGAKKVKTPNIDRMAAEGLRLTNFHTAASICSPSRAAFLTGAYPQRCGLYMGINRNRQAHWFLGLNPDEITIAEQFKKQNYTTAMIGKWHLGSEEPFSYYNQGFDHYYGAPDNMGHGKAFYDDKELVHKATPLDQMTTLYTQRIVKHIGDFKDKPFFIYYAHNYPHTPYKAGAKFKGSSKDGVRGDVIQELDWSIGEVIKALEENGILENTLIIFTSDNGPINNKYARPFSGTKYVSLQGGHCVPLIAYWKGHIEKPAVVDTLANATDLFPTLSELIEAPMPTDRVYDGVSLTPQAVRVGDWKLHLPRTKEQIPFWARKKQETIQSPRLYNLKTDIAEKSDVASQYPDRVAELSALAETTRAKLGEFGIRGSEQRPTGTLFPEVPILSNQSQDWDPLPDSKKGRGKTEFKGKQATTEKPKRKQKK